MRVILMFLYVFVAGTAWAEQVSLIDKDMIPKAQVPLDIEDETSMDEEVMDGASNVTKDDGFEEMRDFVQEEDARIKDIKLLNLDLERSNLMLKKKEIDQKITQLSKADMDPTIPLSSEEVEFARPNIKAVGLFTGAHKRSAVLGVNGINFSVREGQSLSGFNVKGIDAQGVTVEYDDGRSQRIEML